MTSWSSNFPRLTLRRLGGLTAASDEEKKLALAAADVFCSPADNLQETFGLSVLEAMASSLPVVASDWNGYRDLVLHGSTGWLVPCRDLLQVQPQPDALDRRFSLGLQDYDSTVGLRSLGVVLDHAALEKALGDLLAAPERCAAMGEAGRERIESVFAWRVVSGQYRELWSELGERRASARLARRCQPLADGPCRTPVCRPRQCSALCRTLVAGGTGQRSQPAHRHHADLLSCKQLIPDPFPRQPGRQAPGKTRKKEGNGWTLMIWNSSTVTATSRHNSGAASPTCLRNWRL